jgi:hypothetical protein
MWNRRVEWVAAVAFVAGWACVGALQPSWSGALAVTLWIVPSIAVGFAIGGLWAAALAPAAAAAVLATYGFHPCVPRAGVECDLNVPALVLVYFMPPTAVLLLLGAGMRRGFEILRRP